MADVLFDSSIYITAIRAKSGASPALRSLIAETATWLSSVVLEELYAGAIRSNRDLVEELEEDFNRAQRILVPSQTDWTQAGKLLARLAAKYGYEQIGRGRLTNDALIAISSARAGITLLTSNARDFSRLAEFSRFDWRVANSVN